MEQEKLYLVRLPKTPKTNTVCSCSYVNASFIAWVLCVYPGVNFKISKLVTGQWVYT